MPPLSGVLTPVVSILFILQAAIEWSTRCRNETSVDSRFAVRLQRLASPSLNIRRRTRNFPQRAGPFTAEQAAAGRAIYQSTCSTCHLPDLKGTFEAPPLAGANFLNTWRNRPTSDLFSRIRNSMPITNPGSLSDQDTANLVAFILQANGATAGTQPLTLETIVPIGAVTTGGAQPAAQPGRRLGRCRACRRREPRVSPSDLSSRAK